MSELLQANIIRSGITEPIASNIIVQIDKMSAQEAATYQGVDPHFTYRAFSTYLPMNDPMFILFRDYVIDIVFYDPITNLPRKYLIINDPEMHTLDGHWQWVCTRVRGT